MATYMEVEQARSMPGLRLVLQPDTPAPWSEACREIFSVKKIPFVRVRHQVGAPSPALKEWTAQTSAPVAIWEDERPRSTWIEQLYLAERLAPDPPLIPAQIEERMLMFGCCNEICGERGLGWTKRMLMFHHNLSNPKLDPAVRAFSESFARKYNYDPRLAQSGQGRVVEILKALGKRIEEQRARGSRFFIGDRLCALDIYWAAFAVLIEPLADELSPMSPETRKLLANRDPVIQAAVSPLLMEHRDFIYREFLELPLDL